jgi:hypothetical protein
MSVACGSDSKGSHIALNAAQSLFNSRMSSCHVVGVDDGVPELFMVAAELRFRSQSLFPVLGEDGQ